MPNWIIAAMPLLLLQPAGQSTVTKEDFRRQAPTITDRQLRDQLWGIFQKRDQRRNKPAKRPLSDIWLNTRAYPTEVPGLCRKDITILRFARADSASETRDAQTPVRAYGIESFPNYLFLRPPERRYQEAHDYDARERGWDGPCARQSTEEGWWLRAHDEAEAVDGYRAGRISAAALASGSAKIDKCDRDLKWAVPPPSCEAVVAEFAKSPPSSIESCDSDVGVDCYKLDGISDTQTRVEIVSDADAYKARTGKSAAVDTILRLDVAYFIVVADERID